MLHLSSFKTTADIYAVLLSALQDHVAQSKRATDVC